MSKSFIVLCVCACVTLAEPAGAAAHSRATTVALDYRLVLERATRTLPELHVSILDGDRDLRVSTHGATVTIDGDLGEPMLRIGPAGAFANRASVTAVAEKLTSPGHGWQKLSSQQSYVWHEHRLAPPPFAAATGPVARFQIPATVDGRRVEIAGSFVRYARPAFWPWLLAALVFGAAVLAAVRLGRPVTTALGAVAGVAALGSLVAFSVADAPTGRIQWLDIALGVGLGAVMYGLLVRSHGARRSTVAGVLGGAAAAISLGSLGVFRHGVVISALPATASRALLEIAFVCGIAAAATSLRLGGSP
ncbi:MAG TPA: hypothetical protein VFA97_05630 [Gaiellaceae bacterium]|nr:hypothetical protein [Gaiellaceae bacterium]